MENLSLKEYLKLLKFKYRLLSDKDKRELLINEIENAQKKLLEEDGTSYSKSFRKIFKWAPFKLNFKYKLTPVNERSNIKTLILGILLYSLIVFLIGICATIVYSMNNLTEIDNWEANGLLCIVQKMGLTPFFLFAQKYISVKSYGIGLLGGAGAVVSLIKRFDIINKTDASFWALFSKGFFNPIVGSLSAVVIVSIMSSNIQEVYLLAVAFFAGFSERLLDKFEKKLFEIK